MAQFGHFEDEAYVIKDYCLKRPLMNYLWNSRILSGVNHLGGGKGAYGGRALSYIDEAGRGRCSAIADGNRFVYIKEEDGTVWNPGWYPCCTPISHYRCVHGLGYTTLSSRHGDICADLRVFVNDTDPCEIWTVTVTNDSPIPRKVSVYTFTEWSLEGYARYSDYNSYVQAFYDEEPAVLTCLNGAMEKPHAWFNGFMATDRTPTAFETSKNEFLGTYGAPNDPEALCGPLLGNHLAACERMVGAFQHDIPLKPGEAVTFQVLIGVTDSRDTAVSLAKKLFAPGAVETDFAALHRSKHALCSALSVCTPDETVNRFANEWLKQQVQLCAEVGRDTGKGFRDQLQDAWAVASFNPALAKAKIRETLSYMYRDGRCVRGWLPLDHHIYSDGPVWIPLTVNAYLQETGDMAFLDEPVPYLDGEPVPVWEHILTAMRFASQDTGAHGLVHSRDGDWNDSLNMTGLKGKGESVWTSIALYLALHETAEMAALRGENAAADEMNRRAAVIKQAVDQNAWDGDWYLAAINDENEPVGSHTEQEGRIYLNSQTWAVYTGLADPDRAAQCLAAVDTYLDSPYGPLTLTPAYTRFNDRIGRLTGFIPGIWENGTPYCHGGTFKVVADCIAGRGDKAYETIRKILPDSPQNPSEHSGCEPYVVTNMYFGPDNPHRGQTLFAWVTGTAGWMFRAITQYMAGFHPRHGGFCIAPCLPSAWEGVTLRRPYRGDIYDVTVKKPQGVESGVLSVTLDGVPVDPAFIPAVGDGGYHTVCVTMG